MTPHRHASDFRLADRAPLRALLATTLALLAFAAMTLSATAQQPAAPADGAATAEGEEPVNPFVGRDFILFGDEIDVMLADNEIETLESRGSVYLKSDDLEVTGGMLKYIAATGDLNVWKSQNALVKVIREGVTSYCDEFIYNTESGEVTYVGQSESIIDREGGSSVSIAGNDVTITQGEEGSDKAGVTTISIKGGTLGSGRRTLGRAPEPAATPTPTPTPRPTPVLP